MHDIPNSKRGLKKINPYLNSDTLDETKILAKELLTALKLRGVYIQQCHDVICTFHILVPQCGWGFFVFK